MKRALLLAVSALFALMLFNKVYRNSTRNILPKAQN